MANCNDLFQDFYEKIKLSTSKRKDLKDAKDRIRKRIVKHFKDTRKEQAPEFRIQGSYATATIVNPIDGEFDIDDGVYLQNLDPDKSEWPVPKTVHKWVYEAVEGHTSEDPIDKRTCIRVVYSGHYHVDLPVYGIYDKEPYLAEKEKGWHVSDPEAITNWINDEVKNKGKQLRRIIRYIKAWSDNKARSGKLPSGFVLTVLVSNNYEKSERDDSSFAGTIRRIYYQILASTTILNPVDKDENLSDNITESQFENFRERLSTLLSNAGDALKEESKMKACKKWKREFGDRFPKCEDLSEDVATVTSAPAILRDNARSAENAK